MGLSRLLDGSFNVDLYTCHCVKPNTGAAVISNVLIMSNIERVLMKIVGKAYTMNALPTDDPFLSSKKITSHVSLIDSR